MKQEHYEELKHIFCKEETCDFWHKRSRDLCNRKYYQSNIFYAILILTYTADYARHHLKEKNFLCDKCEFRAYSSADIDKHYKEVNIFFTILIKFKRLVVH